MMKRDIKQWVEAVLSGTPMPMPVLSAASAHEQFLLNCAKRVVNAFSLYQQSRKYMGDFCIALRNYLLSFQTEIHSCAVSISKTGGEYGIWADPATGFIKASYQFPDYVDSAFMQTAFLSEVQILVPNASDSHYNLQTDPMVYRTTGFREFRSLAQKIAFYGALNTPVGYTALISLPTGGGKSMITQAVSYQSNGLTIVIVPTVSLAIDQVRAAHKTIKVGSPAEEIFYYSSGIDAKPILNAIKQRKARMLFISPEALILNSSFSAAIKEANSVRYLKSIIIDEAHIVVDWGADFRLDYQCLESWRKQLMSWNPQIRTILLSATFERRCRDILKDFFSEDDKWIEVRCDALRHEPRYMLVKCRSNHEKNHRIVELVRKCPHPMVVYVARPDDAEQIRGVLQEKGINNVNTFTGLTANSKRQELIRDWVNDKFDVMIATSAFGVGVDKSDIRTVLHAYVPQNPNAYYQELGRGGRDQLPCLSIMCMIGDDTAVSFQRISKKVMTTEKIIGRWDSLYNSDLSKRTDNLVMIDTTIKPKYAATDDIFDDSPASEADIRWNVYVLLLLRRFEKIRIAEVIAQSLGYTFVIEVLDDRLRNNDSDLENEIESIRNKEWHFYTAAFEMMRKAIHRNGKDCWSEMFFETYDKVFEYCSGCAAHKMPNIGDSGEFTLKSPVEKPLQNLSPDQLAMFGESKQLILQTKPEELHETVKELTRRRLSCLVVPDSWDSTELFSTDTETGNIIILNGREISELIKKKSWFFVSGLIAIIYKGSDREIYQLLFAITNELQCCNWVRLIHIINKNTYFEWINKSFSDLLDGRYLSAASLIAL
jgi:ATP-dependent DNA helicase RecQ